MKRRNFVKKFSTAAVMTTVPTGVTSANQSNQSEKSDKAEEKKIIYAGKQGQIVRVAQNAYILRGATTKKDINYLADKRDEILTDYDDNNGEVTTQTHSDSGTDKDDGLYEKQGWSVKTDFWAQADNGTGTVEGTSEAYWWGDRADSEDPIKVTITIESHLKASYENRDSAYISVPPAYTVSEEETKATLSHTFDKGNNTPSLHHDKGAVTFYAGDGNCFNWIQQDDRFKFEYDTGDVEYYGTYVRASVGHCWS